MTHCYANICASNLVLFSVIQRYQLIAIISERSNQTLENKLSMHNKDNVLAITTSI